MQEIAHNLYFRIRNEDQGMIFNRNPFPSRSLLAKVRKIHGFSSLEGVISTDRPDRTFPHLNEFSIKNNTKRNKENNQRTNSGTCLLVLADVQRPKATRGSPADLVPTARITCTLRTQSLFRIRDEDQGRISIGTPFLAGPFLPKSAKCTGYCL